MSNLLNLNPRMMKPHFIYLLSSASLFASMLLIPVLAKDDYNATGFEIGLIVGLYNTAVFLSNFLSGRGADVYGRKLFLRLGLILSAIAAIGQIFISDLTTLVIFRVLFGIAAGIFPSALIAFAYEARNKLGKLSSYGSLGWGLGVLAAGIIGVYLGIFIFSSILFVIAYIVALTIRFEAEVKLKVPLFPKKLIRRNLSVYIAVLFRHFGATNVWVIFPLYVKVLGAEEFHATLSVFGVDFRLGYAFIIGIVYCINSLTQFAVMPFMDRFEPTKVILAGLLLTFAAFILFYFATHFYYLMPIEALIAVAWSCVYVGSLRYVTERNIERATATGLLNSAIQLAGIMGSIIGGLISGAVLLVTDSEVFGYQSTMVFAAITVALTIPLYLALCRRDCEQENQAA